MCMQVLQQSIPAVTDKGVQTANSVSVVTDLPAMHLHCASVPV